MDTKQLVQDYIDGMSIKELQQKHNFKGVGTLYYYLKKFNVPKKGKVINYENPFLTESAERDYWLGWIFSDGCVYQDDKHSYVYLGCLDLNILLKFKEFCGDRAKLNKFKYVTPKSKQEKILYKVVINSIELTNYFKNTFGIVGKKSSTLNPDIPITWDLLRGALDGDGTFKKGVVLVSNSKEWVNKIAKFYDDHKLHYTIQKSDSYRICIYKKTDLEKVYHYLYDSATIYLERKKIDLENRLARK
jgi:hypothetical protein